MFLDNKYTKWYFNIINYAKVRVTNNGYYEKHHIIPKCLGGSNDYSNIIALTAREHFICHMLLTKMVEGRDKTRMSFAMWRLAHPKQSKHKINSSMYETTRKLFGRQMSAFNKGRKLSEDTKLQMSTSAKRRWYNVDRRGVNNAANIYGMYHSPWGNFDCVHKLRESCPGSVSIDTLRYLCRYAARNTKLRADTLNKLNLPVDVYKGKTFVEAGFNFVEIKN